MTTRTKQEDAHETLPFNILTDLDMPNKWSQKVDHVRGRSPSLDALFLMIERREITDEEGRKHALSDADITVMQAELLAYLILETKPVLTIETGFFNGLAAGVMTAAHMANGLNGGHVPIQDFARQAENGIGVAIMERLELTGYQIMEHETALVLPQLYMQQLNDGMGLIYLNGSTSFDEQMMEYFYLNRLLNEGGIFAINTAHAARRDLVEYIRRERHDYAIRALSCGITLVQKPFLAEWAGYQSRVKH